MCVFCHIMSGTCGKICLPSTRHQVSKTEVYLFFAISSNPALDAIPEDGFASMGLQPAQMVQLYTDQNGHLLNEKGVRVDSLGRPTRPRGAETPTPRRSGWKGTTWMTRLANM